MHIAIRYYSKTGNTEKLAKEIEKVTKVKAEPVTKKLNKDVDILFLGSSIDAACIDEEVKKFIDNIDVKVGNIVNFSTAALLKSTKKQVEKLLKEKNIPIKKEEF